MFPIDRLAALVYTMDVKKKGRNCYDQTGNLLSHAIRK